MLFCFGRVQRGAVLKMIIFGVMEHKIFDPQSLGGTGRIGCRRAVDAAWAADVRHAFETKSLAQKIIAPLHARAAALMKRLIPKTADAFAVRQGKLMAKLPFMIGACVKGLQLKAVKLRLLPVFKLLQN